MSFWTDPVGSIIGWINDAVNGVQGWVQDAWNSVQDFIDSTIGVVINRLTTLLDEFDKNMAYWSDFTLDFYVATLEVFRLWWEQENNAVKNWVLEQVQNAIEGIEKNVTNVYKTINKTVNNITKNIDKTVKNITKNITKVVGASKDWVTDKIGTAVSWINDQWKNIQKFWEDITGKITNWWDNTWKNISGTIEGWIQDATKFVNDTFKNFVKWIEELPNTVADFINTQIEDVIDYVDEQIPKVVSGMLDFLKPIVQPIKIIGDAMGPIVDFLTGKRPQDPRIKEHQDQVKQKQQEIEDIIEKVKV